MLRVYYLHQLVFFKVDSEDFLHESLSHIPHITLHQTWSVSTKILCYDVTIQGVFLGTGRYSESSLFRKLVIPKARYSENLILLIYKLDFRSFHVRIRVRCPEKYFKKTSSNNFSEPLKKLENSNHKWSYRPKRSGKISKIGFL